MILFLRPTIAAFNSQGVASLKRAPLSDFPLAEKPSWFQKHKKKLLEYTVVGAIVHLSSSILAFGTCYVTVTKFGNLEQSLVAHGNPDLVGAAPGLNIIMTYGLYKSLLPLRLSTTAIGTWSIVRYYRCRREKKLKKLAEKQRERFGES